MDYINLKDGKLYMIKSSFIYMAYPDSNCHYEVGMGYVKAGDQHGNVVMKLPGKHRYSPKTWSIVLYGENTYFVRNSFLRKMP